MASIESNTRSSVHIRCNSLPSSPHPFVSQFEEHLNRLVSSESASSSSSFSSASHKLSGLEDLHDCTYKLLQLPTTQQAFAREFSSKWTDELLDGSLRLLDVCSIVKDCCQDPLSQARDWHNNDASVTISLPTIVTT